MTRSLWGLGAAAALVVIAGLGVSAEQTPSCTIFVQPGESIQAVIDAAPVGAVICLAAGEWVVGGLVINRSLTLRGQGPEETVLATTFSGAPPPGWRLPAGFSFGMSMILIFSSAEKVVIEGIGLSGSRFVETSGIDVRGRVEITITECDIRANYLGKGIWLGSSARATITNCTVSQNSYGIVLQDSARATIANCTITENDDGIELHNTTWAAITNCTINWNGIVGNGIALEDTSEALISGCSVTANGGNGIVLNDSSQAILTGNTVLRNGRRGVALDDVPCDGTSSAFSGRVSGSGNTVPGPGDPDGNEGSAVCPDALVFLMTPEGGELDLRRTSTGE